MGEWRDDSPSCTQGLEPLEALQYHSTPSEMLQQPHRENVAATRPPCLALAATLLESPSPARGPYRGLRSVLPPGVSSLLCRLLSTRCLLPTFLPRRASRNRKKCMRPSSSNFKGVLSSKRPRISTLTRGILLELRKGSLWSAPFLD